MSDFGDDPPPMEEQLRYLVLENRELKAQLQKTIVVDAGVMRDLDARAKKAENQARHWKEQEAKQRRLHHEQGEWKHRALAAELSASDAKDRLRAAEEDRDDLQASFDLRWRADIRAIKRWQAAHPGNELVFPDHADLVVWLMERLDEAHGQSPTP